MARTLNKSSLIYNLSSFISKLLIKNSYEEILFFVSRISFIRFLYG